MNHIKHTKTSKLLLTYKNGIIDKILNKIPESIFKDKNVIFFDPSMGSGQLIGAIEEKLIDVGNKIKDVSKRVFGLENNNFDISIAKHKNYLQGKYMKGKLTRTGFDMPKDMKDKLTKNFCVAITNPPYVGAKQTHQRFYNELCKIADLVVTIQPATPYLNKNKLRNHEEVMIENVLKYKTDTIFVESREVFKNATVENHLAITITNTTQKNNSNKLTSITYKDGKTYKNIDIEDVNIHGIDPKVFNVLRKKFDNYVSKHGSLDDITYYKEKKFRKNICGLPKLRSNIGTRVFYSFIPDDEKKCQYYTTDINEERDYGIEVKSNKQIKNVYTYLKTYVARFGLALLKINPNNHTGRFFRKVPLVNFDKKWTDEMLAKELKITKSEMKFIMKLLGNYHG